MSTANPKWVKKENRIRVKRGKLEKREARVGVKSLHKAPCSGRATAGD